MMSEWSWGEIENETLIHVVVTREGLWYMCKVPMSSQHTLAALKQYFLVPIEEYGLRKLLDNVQIKAVM